MGMPDTPENRARFLGTIPLGRMSTAADVANAALFLAEDSSNFLTGVLLVAGLFRLIDSIKAFPLIFILTDGGPGNVTEVTNYYSYLQAFNFSYLGFSSAITVVLLAATILLSWLIVRSVGWGARAD
jgi:hypothetical protein